MTNKNASKQKASVSISTNNVSVNQQRSMPSNGRRNRPARRQGPLRENGQFSYSVPNGIQTGLSGITKRLLVNDCGFTDQANQFVRNYCDPCGEHTQSLDAARVPDGALNTSAGLFFRSVETIQFPWQTPGLTDLGGLTYSFLVILPNTLRSLAIILARENDGEFDAQTMARFNSAFASKPPSPAGIYPNWLSANDPNNLTYFTMISTDALQNILPPSENGVSGTIDSYRFSSQGINLMFNTPDLVNQGTMTSMRYPANVAVHNFEVDSILTTQGTLFYVNCFTARGPSLVNIVISITNADELPVNAVPTFVGPVTSLPTTNTVILPAGATIRNAQNTFNNSSITYRLNPSAPSIVQMFNPVTTQFINIGSIGPNSGDNTSQSTRLYYIPPPVTGSVPETVGEEEYNVIVLPPVTQADMLQQNPKTDVVLLKESGGVYLPSTIFEPIFNLTKSGDYRKVVFTNILTSPLELLAPGLGWTDSIDANFSISVINLQGIPYACKPFIKINRSIEAVGASDSLIGAFTTGCPNLEESAVAVCKAITDTQPHGYNPNYNSLGLLFAKVLRVVEQIPRILRTGASLSHEVTRLAEMPTSDDEYEEIEIPNRRSQSRLAKVQPRNRRRG